jgi:alcohol dehydrogenase
LLPIGVLVDLGLLKDLISALGSHKLNFAVYDEVLPNPTIESIETGLSLYQKNHCDSVIGFGGGSAMDCAQVIAARAVNPKQTVLKMRGLFRVRRHPVPIFAVPTTTGTGSETTVAAVITDARTHEKFAISDSKLVPAAFHPT